MSTICTQFLCRPIQKYLGSSSTYIYGKYALQWYGILEGFLQIPFPPLPGISGLSGNWVAGPYAGHTVGQILAPPLSEWSVKGAWRQCPIVEALIPQTFYGHNDMHAWEQREKNHVWSFTAMYSLYLLVAPSRIERPQKGSKLVRNTSAVAGL